MRTFIEELSKEERAALEKYEKAKRMFIFYQITFPAMLFGPIYVVTRWQMIAELPWRIAKLMITNYK
ncbi:MAG: hypothetical protein KBC15_02950 [Candidatus Levybacteria bacterium]|nr:hypothetical protein [Candidatus Levybacteria bacterium]